MWMTRSNLVVIIALLCLLAVKFPGPSAAAAPPATPTGKEVIVTNTPLPVTADVSGTIAATQSGAWNVNVLAREPFQQEVECGGFPEEGCAASFSVPPGKRLEIEFVSVRADVPQGNHALIQIFVRQHGIQKVFHHIAVTPQGFVGQYLGGPPSDEFVGTHAVHIYAEPGSEVLVSLQTSPAGAVQMIGAVSGHLIDCAGPGGCPLAGLP